MRYVFVVNPKAGVKNISDDVEILLEKHFGKTGEEYKIVCSEYAGHITDIIKEEAEKGDDVRVYGFGGDGTLNEMIKGAVEFNNVEIGIFPTGSGNDYIKSFGEREAFLHTKNQINGTSINIDIIKTKDSLAVNNACIGFDAKVGYSMAKFKSLPKVSGSNAYNLALVKCLFGKLSEKLKVKIATDDGIEIIKDDFMFAVVSSGMYYGGGFKAAPEARVNDRLLDIILIKKPPLVKIPSMINIYKKGLHLNDPKFKDYLIYRKGLKLEIQSEKPVYSTLDGEGAKVYDEDFTLYDKTVRFILPKGIVY